MLVITVFGTMFGLLAQWRSNLRPGMIARFLEDGVSHLRRSNFLSAGNGNFWLVLGSGMAANTRIALLENQTLHKVPADVLPWDRSGARRGPSVPLLGTGSTWL